MSDEFNSKKRAPRPAKSGYAALPIVYSCSGCSDVAQIANMLALRLDREKLAEMSCITGVGGGIRPLVKMACSGRPILALDGCAMHCVRRCLAQVDVTATVHVDLSRAGVRKRFHADVSPAEAERVWHEVVLPSLERLNAKAASGGS